MAQGECVRSEESFEGLDALVARRGGALLATATLLAGGPVAGEDLLQAALERVMRHWHRVKDEPEIYLRRTIYHLAVDQWRARRRRPEVLGKPRPSSRPPRCGQADRTEPTRSICVWP
jgi:DNA-directed RNA polymerase specialized sigma24 family protein